MRLIGDASGLQQSFNCTCTGKSRSEKCEKSVAPHHNSIVRFCIDALAHHYDQWQYACAEAMHQWDVNDCLPSHSFGWTGLAWGVSQVYLYKLYYIVSPNFVHTQNLLKKSIFTKKNHLPTFYMFTMTSKCIKRTYRIYSYM